MTRKAAYHHGDLRQQLINATREIIEARGPEQFTVADACRLAGVSIAAPYRHFANRDDMLDAVVLDGMARMRDLMTERVAPLNHGTQETISALGKAYVEFAAQEPGVFRLIFRKVEDEERHAILEAAGRETYGVLLSEVALFLNKTEVDEQVLRLALPLWTFVHGTAMLLIEDMLRVADFEVQTDAMIDAVCSQLTTALSTRQ